MWFVSWNKTRMDPDLIFCSWYFTRQWGEDCNHLKIFKKAGTFVRYNMLRNIQLWKKHSCNWKNGNTFDRPQDFVYTIPNSEENIQEMVLLHMFICRMLICVIMYLFQKCSIHRFHFTIHKWNQIPNWHYDNIIFFSLKENDLSQYLNIVKLLTYILTEGHRIRLLTYSSWKRVSWWSAFKLHWLAHYYGLELLRVQTVWHIHLATNSLM